MSSPQPELPAVATRLFAEHLELPEAEQDARFDALCVQHPDLAEHLHQLREQRRQQQTPPPAADADEPAAAMAAPGTDAVSAKRTPTVMLQESDRSALDGQREPPAMPAAVPGERYTVLGELGRGGMGVALRVFDTVLRRQLAMKVLASDPDASADDRQALVARFLDEARVTGCLEHPCIVPVYDLHHDATGRIFFTMPIIEGVDLHEVIQLLKTGDAEWTLPRVAGVILKVCEAVAFAHNRGVLHRDLTPANVRIGKFGEVHVIDWGLAKVLGRSAADDTAASSSPASTASPAPGTRPPSDQPQGTSRTKRRWWRTDRTPSATMHGTVLGTPAYMPPEQAEGRLDEIGPRSDVYAVGALLYHVLTGAAPYSGRQREYAPERVLRLVRRGKPPSIDRLERHAPPELVAISEKAMSRSQDDRYADMNAMASDLRAYIDGRVVPTYERGSWAVLRKLILRNRIASLVVAGGLFAILFNLVEFGVSHYRYRQLLADHSEQLVAARKEGATAAGIADDASLATRLRDDAWQLVKQRETPSSHHELALAKAHVAMLLDAAPRSAVVEAAALVRCGRAEPALLALQRVESTEPAVTLTALAFEGLARAMLGDREAAEQCRERLLAGVKALAADAPERGELEALLAELTAAAAAR